MVLESNTLDVLFVKDGQQGEDGKVLYTWIKYAKDANGTGMTDDPNGAIYIGISYNNESSIESNDPTQYAWTKIQGADGKKGEDAYTIFLENENISFATDKNRNPLSEQAYTSGITIMKGAKPVTDFIIGDIAKTQGIAVAKTDTAIAISVVNGNPLPNDSGEIEIPITVGGTVFKKILTWTCAKKGDQGEQGERGLQGIQGPQGIQGVAGKDGTNGKTAYFHIKYSSVANPTSSSQLTETPSTYIGTYVDFTETDSTDPKKYTWSQFVGSQGPKGEQGIAGVGVDGKTSYLHIAYANSADGKTGFSTSDSTNKSYIGQYTDFTPNDSTDYTKYSWSLIRGKDGTDGVSPTVSVIKNGKTTTITITDKNGTHTQTVKDGTDGTPGQTGKDGKTTYFHVKYSNDGGQTFTSNSGEDVGAYIGTCTDYNQADPTTVGAYTWARIKGEKGDQGVRGEKGKDGTSVTITNKSITYQLSTSGTTIPTGTWQTSPQTIPEGQYQWTKTSVTYSDGNKTESYSISYHGKNGSNGTSVKTTSTSVKYQVGDSGTTKPTGTWQANVPTVVQGKYLWTQTIVNYSDGNSTESYSVAYRGIDGNNGVNGMNAATIYLYQRATSTPNKPSNTLTYTFSTTKITGTLNNGWSTAIPTGTDAVYVTVASVSSKNDTATIATSAWSAPVVLAQNGKTGSDGKAGLNVATIYLYQRNTSKPSKPSASVTYTFSTGVASGLNNGWSQKIPDGTNPLYVTLATASSNTATDTILSSEWSDVVVMAQNGEDGQDGTSITITSKSVTYQASSSGTTTPTGTWSTSVPTVNNGQYLWTKTTVQYSDDNKTEAYSVSYKGTNGTNGTSVTVSKTEVTYQVSTSGTTAPTGTWSTTMPTCDQGLYLWTKTYVKYSDGKDTTSYAVSYKGIDGEKFAFNMLRETNQGSKHWVNLGASGKYSVESIITDDNINAAKLICTEAIASNEWQFCDFSDYEMLKSLKASTTYTLSYDIKANRSGKILHNIKTGGGQKVFFANDIACKVLGNETWEHVSLKMTSGTTLPNLDGQVIYMFGDALSKVGYSIIKNLKLTEGIVDTPWAPHPEDLEGRGVSETVQYYLATSQASGVTSSTSGWSTDITTQKLTADKKYLWNCYQTKYSDGTSEPISTPKVIGVYGDKGNGIVASVQRPNKTEFWWSQVGAVGHKDTFDDSSNTRNNCRVGDIFTVMGTSTEGNSHTVYYKSTTDSGDLAGECINHVVAESGADAKNLTITPSSQYFKSTDGGKTFAPNQITIKPTIQGEISFGKWQYSIDGGVSFADIVSGQKGLTISNNVLSISKDSSLYSDAVTMVTFRAVANDSSFYDTCSIAKIYDVSDIGDGRNLLWNSNFAKTDEAITGTTNSWGLHTRGTNLVASIDTSTKHNGFNTLKTVSAANGDKNSSNDLEWFAWGISERTSDNLHSKNQNYTLSFYAKASVTTDFIVRWGYDAYGADTTRTLTTNWQKYEIKLHQATSAYSITIIFKLLTAGTVWFSEFKLEKGSSATGYSTAPEDLQTAILSTKSEISDVSLKVDNNKQAIEQRVEKTTYEQDLKLVKGDISKANEGLNKWRYEIYPKSLFASEYQGKSTMDVFAKNTNLTPSQSVLINDTDFGKSWAYGDNYIGYALTFVKFSAAKSIAITFKHDDGAHLYLNGKLIGGSDAYSQTGESLTLDFVKGWNCIEVVVNEGASTEGFKLGTTLSALPECQLMNCYYGTPVARQSHITNQLVENTTNIDGISTKVSKVTSVIGEGGENFTSFKNEYSDFKQTMNGFKTTVSQTYVTKDDFNGLEIGGRNLLLYSQTIRAHKDYYGVGWLTDEVETFNGCPVWSVKNQWGRLTWLFKSHVIDRGLVKVGDTLTYSLYAKTNNASGKSINCSYRFKGNANAYWFNGSAFNVGTNWTRYSVTFTITKDMLATDTYMTEIGFEETASMSGDDKVYYACPKLERGTKATDYTPALEDNEINGQNLVSNLSSNWEQGSVSYVANSTYASIKTVLATRLRTEDVFSVSGNVTISAGTSTNSSKEELNFYYVLFDVNKKAIGVPASGSEWQSLTSPKIINCGDAKYMAIILRWGSGSTVITPSDISQICLKIERGTSATPFTLAPEDVNGKIVNVETIANQTANKFEWIVKGGDSSSNFTLTDRVADLVAERINFKGLVTFSGLSTDAKNEIGKVAQSKVDGLEVGGRNLIINSNLSRTLTNVTNDGCSNMTVVSDSVYGHALKFTAVNQRRVFWATSNVWVKDKTYTVSFVAKSSVTGQKIRPSRSTADLGDDITLTTSYARYTTKITSLDTNAGGTLSFSCTNAVGDITITNVKLEVGNKATDWTPAPEDVSQDATNKASQALTDAKNYSSNAVNWVTNNGSSTTSLNSMVKKWTDGAVSDTTQINGGWIKANTITASKIAVGDFTNYCQLNKDTASSYGFTATDDIKGVWFTASPIDRDKDISQWFTCEGGQKLYVEYDLSTTVKGKLKASDTDISYLTSGIMIFVTNGTKEIISYTRSKGVTATSDGAITHISLVETLPADARFFKVVLQTDGQRNTFSGTLKIRNPQVRKATTGKLIVDGSITADKIATDAIKSRNYISSGGTQGSFLNLSDGSFTSPNLSWDSNGNLIAKNANLSGEITATNGSIAGWTIISNKMYTTGSGKYTGIGKYGSAYAFWAGATSNDNGNSAVFKVSHTGKLTATDADITGTITATNGKIGRYDITSTYLMTNSGSNASGIGGNQAFWAGAEDSNSAPFRVGYDGVLWAENAAIRGSIETGNLGDEGDTVSIINGHIGIQGTSNNVEIYSTGFKFGIDGDYYLMSVSEGVKCYRNLYATDFVADGWLYCSEVHSSGAVVIGADSESFYWAHGYQIARGTSWGGVCVGDDSQQLRLYGSSIWASHSISTSDENLKENFTTLDQYENFYMNLNPIGFNYIGDYDGKKTHFGFGAHKTEDVLESEGYDADKFAVVTHRPLVQEDIEKRFGKDVEVDIETEYGVSYTEFIALNTHMIQKIRRELTKVKQEKADLEVRLQAIEAKLGL